MQNNRRYQFNWTLIGDLEAGRPNLGNTTRLEVYRLMQFSFRDVLEARLGTDTTDELFYAAGELAGREFYKQYLQNCLDFESFVKESQRMLREMGIGILRVERADLEHGELIVTVSEDLDCSGLPELDHEICTYDEGFLSALLESFTGKKFTVKEIDCWCTGDRTCRFHARSI